MSEFNKCKIGVPLDTHEMSWFQAFCGGWMLLLSVFLAVIQPREQWLFVGAAVVLVATLMWACREEPHA